MGVADRDYMRDVLYEPERKRTGRVVRVASTKVRRWYSLCGQSVTLNDLIEAVIAVGVVVAVLILTKRLV